MKTLALVALLVASVFGQLDMEKTLALSPKEKQYSTTYDKFKDITTIRSANFTVNDLNGKMKLGTGIMLVLRFVGREPSKESHYHFEISSASARGDRVADAGGIIALIDGKRIDMLAGGSDAEVKQSKGLGILFGSSLYVNERLLVPIRPAVADALRTAKTVEIQASREEFALHGPSLVVFKSILELAPN